MDDSILDSLTYSIVDSLISSINLNGHASFVVCGGNSPLPLYNNLSKKDLDWSKVSIFLGDDRVVPADHVDSNNYLKSRKQYNEIVNINIIIIFITSSSSWN